MDITKKNRITIIPIIKHATADIAVTHSSEFQEHCTESDFPPDKLSLIQIDPFLTSEHSEGDRIYNFPFLHNEDLSPWEDGNLYIWHLASTPKYLNKSSSGLRNLASRLMDFKIYCDSEEIDYLDLSGRRTFNRPPYRYFHYLNDAGELAPENINQRTGVVYNFYKYLVKIGRNIDIDRVDTVSEISIYFTSKWGLGSKTVLKRGQTRPTTRYASPVEIGYIRDEGEDLKPLYTDQQKCLMSTIRTEQFDVDERLMVLFSLATGARKQSLFTLRMKHIEYFDEIYLLSDQTYKLVAGPVTGIDTKYDKRQTLYLEYWLAEEIKIYANSKIAKHRRRKFQENFEDKHPSLPRLKDEDVYLFLSEQGNEHYMAKDDPRYKLTLNPPIGKRADTLKKKIIRLTSEEFPRQFTFHWLRASYAFNYYDHLKPLVDNGLMTLSDCLQSVRRRMHHSDIKTTENYLKLFSNIQDKKVAQEQFESKLFQSTKKIWESL